MAKKEKKSESITIPPTDFEVQPVTNEVVSVESLITLAIKQNIPVESLERLLAMRRELKDEFAKKAFNEAMAAFQADCPTIVKTKEVKTRAGVVAYKYAPIESIVEQVAPFLQRHGFSYSTTMELMPAGVKVIVKATHKDGHSELSPMEVPLGNKTDIMSASQVVAAAQTFAKRYAFCNAFGILTGDEDIDGRTDTMKIEEKSKPQPKSKEISETDRIKISIQSNLLKLRASVTPENVYNIVEDLTGLELIEENYKEIDSRLAYLVAQDKKPRE